MVDGWRKGEFTETKNNMFVRFDFLHTSSHLSLEYPRSFGPHMLARQSKHDSTNAEAESCLIIAEHKRSASLLQYYA